MKLINNNPTIFDSAKIFVKKNIYHKIVNNKIKLLEDKRSISIAPPTFNYEYDKLYTIYVEGNLKSVDGKTIKPTRTMFYVEK